MNKLLSIILCLMLFSECNHFRHNPELTTVDIIEGIRRSIKMSVSVVSNDILFIPLETFDENIVAKITKILLYGDDHIIVIDDLPQILLFDKTGKFVRKIGNTGESKNEFLSIYSSIVVNNELFVLDIHLNTTFCYDLQTGKCVRTLAHKFIPFSIEYFNDSLLVYYCSMPPYPRVPFSRLHFISPDFEKSDSIWYDTEYSAIKREFFDEGRVSTYMKNGNMYMWDSNLDTVFYLNDRFERKSEYQLFIGRHALSEDDKYNIHYVDSMKDDEFMITKVMETDKFFFIEGLFGRRYAKRILYNKETQRSRDIIFNLDIHDAGFHNDIDGSIPFWPKGQADTNVLYDFISPYELKQLMDNPYFKTIKFRNQQQNDSIMRYIRSAKITDNPIIFLVTVKQ